MPHRFQPLYHAERIEIVNPQGDVGLITLWSPLRTVKRKLSEIAPDALHPQRSRIAAIGNLYGDGMHVMLCNLLFNPQVKHLIAVGEDLGLATCEEIERFIAHGLEDVQLLGAPMKQIKGTSRIFPDVPGFDESPLRDRLTFAHLGRLSTAGLQSALTSRLAELPSTPEDSIPPRIRVEGATDGAARTAPRAPSMTRRPSQLSSHQVERPTPLRCWEELVVRTMRFGREVELRNGPRIELLNVKAVISQPQREPAEALRARGFELQELVAYGEKMLDPSLPEGISYTYGNRLRAHFERDGAPLDALEQAIATLTHNPESRHAYVSLWDNELDLPSPPAPHTPSTATSTSPDTPFTATSASPDTPFTDTSAPSSPCLVTLFFRRNEGSTLCLTATYRAHNLLTAWLRNVYGLMAIQRHVSAGCGMNPGPLTLISHSLGIDPLSPRYALAQSVAERWRSDDEVDVASGKRSLRQDPNGYFVVSVDRAQRKIVAEHRFQGVLIERYSGRRASDIAKAIAGGLAVSLPSHALWLGGELARAEAQLNAGVHDRGEDA